MSMFVEAATAKVLAAIILGGTQGSDLVEMQQPFSVTDYGNSWLVLGTPSDYTKLGLKKCIFHIFVRKSNAETMGLGFNAQFGTPALEADWRSRVSAQDAAAWRTGTALAPSDAEIALNAVLVGGVINDPEHALRYARALMQASSKAAMIAPQKLEAIERDGNWVITRSRADPSRGPDAVMSFSRRTGQVMSGTF